MIRSKQNATDRAPGRTGGTTAALSLSPASFEHLRKVIYDASGIHLKEAKRQMVQSRLTSRLRYLGLSDFESYIQYLSADADEMTQMLNRITTNKTYFFREPKHFKYLRDHVLPEITRGVTNPEQRVLNAWCAASSTGEEPYSIAMVLNQYFAQRGAWKVRLLASDLDTNVLVTAKAATYPRQALTSLPQAFAKNNTLDDPAGDPDAFIISPEVRNLVQFRRVNLMGERYPIKSMLDFIFCRNVFIYFTREDRDNVVRRFIKLLKPGGYLFLGHSEVLDVKDFGGKIKFVGNTTYQKVAE